MTRKLYTLYIQDGGRMSGFRYRGVFPNRDAQILMDPGELFAVEDTELQNYQQTINNNDSPGSYFLFEVAGTPAGPNGRMNFVWMGQFECPQDASRAAVNHFAFSSHYFARVYNVAQARRMFHKTENLYVLPELQSKRLH